MLLTQHRERKREDVIPNMRHPKLLNRTEAEPPREITGHHGTEHTKPPSERANSPLRQPLAPGHGAPLLPRDSKDQGRRPWENVYKIEEHWDHPSPESRHNIARDKAQPKPMNSYNRKGPGLHNNNLKRGYTIEM